MEGIFKVVVASMFVQMTIMLYPVVVVCVCREKALFEFVKAVAVVGRVSCSLLEAFRVLS
jgi:hypothetical protein